MSDFKLRINEREYFGWENVFIFRSMNSISGAFVVDSNDFFEGGTNKSEIKMEHAVKIEIEDQQVLDGWIDRMPIKWGTEYKRMEIHGRDKTCDLVDCSFDATPNEWKEQTVENIIRNLINPFGIDLVVDAGITGQTGQTIETFKANEGQFVYELIAEICRDYGILPITKGDGKLTLTKATAGDYALDRIAVGNNAKAGMLDQSNEDRYSNYKVKGVGIGTDNKGLPDFTECEGLFSDPIIKRTRPLTIFAETPTNTGACLNRAKWESRVRAGNSRKIQYVVQGWVQSTGKIWDINTLVDIDDEITGERTTKLISEIIFEYSEEDGEIAYITVVDKDTYNMADSAINIKSEFD